MPPPADLVLAAEGLTKRFPGVVALSGVGFEVRAGEVHALMGQNGAGKSTLIRILTGAERADGGRIRLAGSDVRPGSPAEAQRLGVCAVYQEVNLVPTLSVAENLFLGRQPRTWWGVRWGVMRRRAREAMGSLGVHIDVERAVGSLPVAVQQMVAVARALETAARIIVFDEPTSSLDAREAERLFGVIETLKSRGLGLVFITHFLDQVYRVSDRITVLRNGQKVGTWDARELGKQDLVNAMLGGAAVSRAPAAQDAVAERSATSRSASAALRVNRIGKRGVLEPTSFQVGPGEVLGLAGLLGSGRTETARLVFGAERRDSGSVSVGGRFIPVGSPRRAIAAGLGMTPEDRKTEGLFLRMSVRENIAMVAQRRMSPWGLVRKHRHAALAREMVSRLGIACAGIQQPVGTLSGGNQQKVLLARWLANRPTVLILDEPTRGVDVGAKTQIEALVEELKREGVAIVFISAELDEVARRCDRVLVLRDRRVVGEPTGPRASEDDIRRMIAGEEGVGG